MAMGLWPPVETAQRPARYLAAVEAIERGDASWHDVPTTTKLLMPVDLIIRAAAATTSRAAGRHRAVRRHNPGRTRARSRTTKRK